MRYQQMRWCIGKHLIATQLAARPAIRTKMSLPQSLAVGSTNPCVDERLLPGLTQQPAIDMVQRKRQR